MALLAALLLATASDPDVAKVVAAIHVAARENAARPEPRRSSGDELADLYVRTACGSGVAAKAVVTGLAYAIETKGMLAASPLLGGAFDDVETAEERKARLAVMGTPTLRGRSDWLAHFVMSGALAALLQRPTAEAIGLQKELTDAARKDDGGGTGFSFTDLLADLAGIEFAEWLLEDRKPGRGSPRERLEACARSFEGACFLPDPAGLEDGLALAAFDEKWGGPKSPRFRTECERLRALVREHVRRWKDDRQR